ncbi:hypothetical protein NC653_029846 [Populus alba x Populus x berolinensis]|uniref:Uncharacterized protein n=1 Tax=Populus alba x Populus x berolinensis TaxID=444605 RepID=A0AAD6Q5Q1_9ROSI|nr:hypothetical protein NC653_029846 [Populus alba x Populus x berolinensis]
MFGLICSFLENYCKTADLKRRSDILSILFQLDSRPTREQPPSRRRPNFPKSNGQPASNPSRLHCAPPRSTQLIPKLASKRAMVFFIEWDSAKRQRSVDGCSS